MKKGCYVSVGRCPTASLRCRVGRFWTSATGRQHPSRRRDAGAVRRLRGQLASAPHNPVSPRRRLYQRAAHALGGVTGKLGGNLRGIEDAIKKPPARVSYGKQSTGLFSYFPALAGAIRPWDAVPHPASFLSRKLGKELHPPTARTRANGSHRRGVQPPPSGATCPGCNPRARALAS